MGEWISEETRDVSSVASQTDFALVEIEKMTKRGYVSSRQIPNSNFSHLFTDENGVLKFYNSITNTVQTVSLT